ncbi:hypothetical protein E4T56_gene14556 [Termitomyces sp. T112]|nr:hypothetical protein E4T56_gene14556 [Termitomyces sp. T112]
MGRLSASHKSPPRMPPFPDHPTKTPPSLQTAPCFPPSATWDKTWSASGPPGNPPPPPWTTLQKPRQSSREDKLTPLTTPVPGTSVVPTLKLLPPSVIHHHLVQIRKQRSGGDYWNAGGRHDKIWEIPGNLPFPKTPNALPNFHPCPVPISISPDAPSANSNASLANSDGPLANFNTFPAATDTYPGSPKPQEPPLLFLIFATHHQLNTLAAIPEYHDNLGATRVPK